MISSGQAWAIKQLNDIAKASNGLFELFDIVETVEQRKPVSVTVSINCKAYSKKETGIPFKVREKIRIDIPWRFPLHVPSANFSHKKYGAFPHVQWGDQICLFQSPETEWQPSQGMFGFIERLDQWLKAGAEGLLDPIGLPLHPPVAYATSNFKLIPKQNAPQPTSSYWGGYVEVTRENKVVAELGNWIKHGDDLPEVRLASVILLSGDMPYEYPQTMFDLLMTLNERDLPIEIVRLIIELGILRTKKGDRAIFILGAAMRGISGGQRLQHLTGWLINAEQTDKFREAIIAATEEDKADIKLFYEWAATAKVEWCGIMEERPEIIERRDSKSVASFWQGKNVTILGCGAIGSSIANILARAGVNKLQLFDKSVVTPGILVRQDFRRDHIGYSKASALNLNVIQINPDIEVNHHIIDLVNLFDDTERLAYVMQADVVIDATASATFANALEHFFRNNLKNHPPIVTMSIGHNADFGLMTLSTERVLGMSLDVDRRSKIGFANSVSGKLFLEEFWPTSTSRRQFFQPEPGCSSPTFRGSFADVLALTSQMINIAAEWLSKDAAIPVQRTFAINLSNKGSSVLPARNVQFEWQNYQSLNDQLNGFEIRINPSALKSILSWIRRSERVNGERVETGGVLFGQLDEFLKVIWIDEISGPPPDSVSSPSCFVCGTAGVLELHEEKLKRTTGTIVFMGMWHTHPHGMPIPSYTDLSAMRSLLGDTKDYLGQYFLMLIVGGTSSFPIVSASVFERNSYE
ncbi:hypothetical protein GCM10028807_60110 [Spirosoma daeguense]